MRRIVCVAVRQHVGGNLAGVGVHTQVQLEPAPAQAVVLGRTPLPLITGLAFFLLGAGPVVWVVSTTTLRQTVTPAGLLGRVSALNVLAYGARPVGAVLAALFGEAFGSEACLVLAAFGFLTQVLVIFGSPVPRLVQLPTALA